MTLCARFAVLLHLVLICGCSLLVKEPRVTITRTTITGLDTAGADIECALAISNPNSYDLTLLGYTYDLRIMNVPFASGGRQEPLAMPGGKQTDMRLPVRIKYADLLKILKRRPDPDRVPYRLQAHLRIDTPVGKTFIPVDITNTFKIPDSFRPEFYLDKLFGIASSPR